MYVVYLAGGIASGKSTAAHYLAGRGAVRCDLDALSREVLRSPSPLVFEIAEHFGDDLIDPSTGELKRDLLAARAFASDKSLTKLEALEHPAIIALMQERMDEAEHDSVPLFVVEIPLLDRMSDWFYLADEVLYISCAQERRARFAQERGMSPEDFERRDAQQPSDAELRELADTVIENNSDYSSFIAALDTWWCERQPRYFSEL